MMKAYPGKAQKLNTQSSYPNVLFENSRQQKWINFTMRNLYEEENSKSSFSDSFSPTRFASASRIPHVDFLTLT